MHRTLKLFVMAVDKPTGTAPAPQPDVELEAASEDGLLLAAHDALAKRALRVRALSFTPTGLLAYAEYAP